MKKTTLVLAALLLVLFVSEVVCIRSRQASATTNQSTVIPAANYPRNNITAQDLQPTASVQ